MPVTPLVFIVNAVLLLIGLILAIIIGRASSLHNYNYGISEVQERMKWIALRCIVLFIFLAIAAVIFNLTTLLL